MPNFNGEDLVVTLDTLTTEIAWQDIYSDWKDWMLTSPSNLSYPQAFSTSGGEPLSTTLTAGAYYFLRNDLGWRIRPPEEDITILATGNLIPYDADIDMFIPTIGAYTTNIVGLQPITQQVSTGGGTGLTAQQTADAVWDEPTSTHDTAGSTGKHLRRIRNQRV